MVLNAREATAWGKDQASEEWERVFSAIVAVEPGRAARIRLQDDDKY
jgi:hypothetical protein